MLSPSRVVRQRCIPVVESLGWLSWCPLRPRLTLWGPRQWPKGTGRRACHPQIRRGWRGEPPLPGVSAAQHDAALPPEWAGNAGAAGQSENPSLAARSCPRCKWVVGLKGSDGHKEAEGPLDPEGEETRRQEEGWTKPGGGDAKAAGSGCRRGVEASSCGVGWRKKRALSEMSVLSKGKAQSSWEQPVTHAPVLFPPCRRM